MLNFVKKNMGNCIHCGATEGWCDCSTPPRVLPKIETPKGVTIEEAVAMLGGIASMYQVHGGFCLKSDVLEKVYQMPNRAFGYHHFCDVAREMAWAHYCATPIGAIEDALRHRDRLSKEERYAYKGKSIIRVIEQREGGNGEWAFHQAYSDRVQEKYRNGFVPRDIFQITNWGTYALLRAVREYAQPHLTFDGKPVSEDEIIVLEAHGYNRDEYTPNPENKEFWYIKTLCNGTVERGYKIGEHEYRVWLNGRLLNLNVEQATFTEQHLNFHAADYFGYSDYDEDAFSYVVKAEAFIGE